VTQKLGVGAAGGFEGIGQFGRAAEIAAVVQRSGEADECRRMQGGRRAERVAGDAAEEAALRLRLTGRSATSSAVLLLSSSSRCQMCRTQATANSRSFLSLALPLARTNSSIAAGSEQESHSCSVMGGALTACPE
jgi:hypothetical protein